MTRDNSFEKRLVAEFLFVRHTFFPSWDKQGAWKAKYGFPDEYRRPLGYCDKETKTIWIGPQKPEPDRLHLRKLLIHEVCHALTAKEGHSSSFFEQFMLASNIAEEIGDLPLRDVILEEIREYEKENRVTAEVIYGRITELVTSQPKVWPYEDVFDEMCSEYSLKHEELIKTAPEMKKIYEDAVEEKLYVDRMSGYTDKK